MHATFSDFIKAHIDKHQTAGEHWPVDAEFALKIRYSTWPIGWGVQRYMDFFQTREQLDARIAELHHWARLEDNYVAYQAYEWDFGPNVMHDVSYNASNL